MTIYYEQFIKSDGYWFEVRQEQNGKFSIFNTQRKKNPLDREGTGFYVSCDPFDSLEEAKEYLNRLDT